MSLPQKVKEAVEIINQYRQEVSKGVGRAEYTCICCKKNKIKLLYPDRSNLLKQEQEMWDNGTLEKVSFGFGSIHDMESFYIAICDTCLTEALNNNIVVKYRDLQKEVRKFDEDYELFRE